MTKQEMRDLWKQYMDGDEYLKFDRVNPTVGNRPDLNAFILLDHLVPGNKDLIAAARHDEYCLSIDPDDLARVVTPEHILTLVRCGVRYNYDDEAFELFA